MKKEGGAPEEVLLADRPLQVDIVLWGIAVLIIFYFIAHKFGMTAFSATAPGKLYLFLDKHAVVYGQRAIAAPLTSSKPGLSSAPLCRL